jgi:hypothetical protein
MRHIVQSFQSHVGKRGVHFYDDQSCNFLTWAEVFQFVRSLPGEGKDDHFADKLTDSLANYNPDSEFLAVHQKGNSVSVELYSDISRNVV